MDVLPGEVHVKSSVESALRKTKTPEQRSNIVSGMILAEQLVRFEGLNPKAVDALPQDEILRSIRNTGHFPKGIQLHDYLDFVQGMLSHIVYLTNKKESA